MMNRSDDMTSIKAAESRWPNGAKAAISFTMDNMGEAADLDRGLWPAAEPIGAHYSVTKVLPQMLEMLQRHNVKATYFIESWNLQVYPDAIRSVHAAGHEVAWHAYRHEAWSKLDAAAEKANFERSFGETGMASFVKKSGEGEHPMQPYRGFRPPGGIIHGERTLKLCREYGLEYISPAAEDAAVVKTEQGDQIAILPFKWRTVDAYYYMEAFGGLREMKGEIGKAPQSPGVLAQHYIAEIDKAIETGGFCSLLYHPFLTDSPERVQAMDTVMQYLVKKRDEGAIWLARCKDIAEWLKEHPESVGTDPGWDSSSWR